MTILEDAVYNYIRSMNVIDMEKYIYANLTKHFDEVADPDKREKFIYDWCERTSDD
jgi:hypothetical protein